MAFVLTWKPVLQPLMLREYHPDYGEEKIMVCVNPQPAFWQERNDLLIQYGLKMSEAQTLAKKAEIASPKYKADAKAKADEANTALLLWGETVFVPLMHDWFARLWSFGDEQYTAADIDQYQEIDPHFAAWVKARSIEMVEAHASARKKA